MAKYEYYIPSKQVVISADNARQFIGVARHYLSAIRIGEVLRNYFNKPFEGRTPQEIVRVEMQCLAIIAAMKVNGSIIAVTDRLGAHQLVMLELTRLLGEQAKVLSDKVANEIAITDKDISDIKNLYCGVKETKAGKVYKLQYNNKSINICLYDQKDVD